jgi:hypothetical protein
MLIPWFMAGRQFGYRRRRDQIFAYTEYSLWAKHLVLLYTYLGSKSTCIVQRVLMCPGHEKLRLGRARFGDEAG